MGFLPKDVANIGADQYRAAVNYGDMAKDEAKQAAKPGTAAKANKGYVRFSTSGRSVVVSKVNNKVDVFIDLALRVNASNNKLIRQQFLNSIREDIKFIPQERREEIERLILTGSTEYGKGTDQEKPLSRRDIAAVFTHFDEQYNTPNGRRNIIKNILVDAANRAGYDTNFEGFCQLAFGLSSDQFVESFSPAFKVKKEADITAEDRLAGRTLEHSEANFRAMLITVRQIVEQKVLDVSLNSHVETELSGWAENVTGDYGFELTDEVKAKWKTLLRPILDLYPGIKNLAPKDVAGTDFPGKILGLFVDHILPLEYKTAIRNVQALGIPADSPEFHEAAKTYLSVDSVVTLAKSFFGKATDAKFIKAIGQLAGDSDDPLVQKSRSAVGVTLAGLRDVGLVAAAKMGTANKVMSGAAVSKSEALEIGESNRGALDVFANESRLDWFVKCFIAERYGEGEIHVGDDQSAVFVVKDTKAKAEEAAKNILVAAQFQHGQRFVKKEEVNGTEQIVGAKNGAGGFEQFVGKVVDQLVCEETLKELKCSADDLLSFATLTLPNVFASKRDELFVQNEGLAEQVDLFDQQHVDEAVEALKKGYKRLGKEVAAFDKATRKFQKVFVKLVNRYDKGARLSNETAVKLKRDMDDVLRRIRCDAARELGALMPLDTDAKTRLAKSVMTDAAERFRGEMNRRLSSLLLAKGYSCQLEKDKAPVPGVEVFETSANVVEAILDWKSRHEGKLVTDANGLHLVNDQEIENRLYSRFSDTFHAILAAKLPKDNYLLPAKKVAEIRKEFAKAVGDEMAKFQKLEATFESKFLKYGTDVLVSIMKSGDKPFEDCKALSDKERKSFAYDLVKNVMVANRERLRETIFEIAKDPQHASKSKLVEDIWAEISAGGFGKKVDEIVADRKAELETWLEKGKFRTRLEEQLFTSAKNMPGAEDISTLELRKLIHANAEPFFADASVHPAFAVSGGKMAFCRRASDAALYGLAERIAGFAALKQAFAAEAKKVDESYETLPNKDKMREAVLAEIAGAAELPDVKLAAGFYRNRLDEALKKVVDEKQKSFKEYANAYRYAFDNVRRVAKSSLAGLESKLDLLLAKSLMSESDDRPEQYLQPAVDALRARIYDVFAFEIAPDPDKFISIGDDEIASQVNDLVDKLVNRLEVGLPTVAAGFVSDAVLENASKWDIVPWARVDDSLRRLGFGEYVVDGNPITEGLRSQLNETMKLPKYAELKRAAIPALVEIAWAEARGLAAPKAALKAVEDYDAFLRDAAEDYITTTFNIKALNNDVKLAKSYVDLELARHNLPTEKSVYGDTVRDRSLEYFLKHVKSEAEQMYAASAKGEAYQPALMTEEFFDGFINRIKNDALTTSIDTWINEVSSKVVDLLSASESWKNLLIVDENLPEKTRQRCLEVAKFNRAALEHAVQQYALTLIGDITTYEQLVNPMRQELLQKILVRNVDHEIGQTLTDCRARMDFELELDHAVDTAVASYEEILFLRMFAVPEEKLAVYTSLDQIYADKSLPMVLRDGKKYEKHREAIRCLCGNFRDRIWSNIEGKRKGVKNFTENNRAVDVVREFGNDYLKEVLNSPKYYKKEKGLLNDFADEVAKAKGIKIDRSVYGFDIPGLLASFTGLFTGLFKKHG